MYFYFIVWIADVQILSFGMPMFNFVVWNVDVQFQYHLTVSLTMQIVCVCMGSSVRDLDLTDHHF